MRTDDRDKYAHLYSQNNLITLVTSKKLKKVNDVARKLVKIRNFAKRLMKVDGLPN